MPNPYLTRITNVKISDYHTPNAAKPAAVRGDRLNHPRGNSFLFVQYAGWSTASGEFADHLHPKSVDPDSTDNTTETNRADHGLH